MNLVIRRSLIFLCTYFFCSVTYSQNRADSINACWIIRNTLNLTFIQKNSAIIIQNSKDDCVLSLIKKISDSTFNASGKKYLSTLSSIRQASDGFVSEYFYDIGIHLFYKNFSNLFDFIYTKNSLFITPMEKMVIEAVGIEISDSKNKYLARKNLYDYLKSKERELNMSSDRRLYLNNLKFRIFEFADNQ